MLGHAAVRYPQLLPQRGLAPLAAITRAAEVFEREAAVGTQAGRVRAIHARIELDGRGWIEQLAQCGVLFLADVGEEKREHAAQADLPLLRGARDAGAIAEQRAMVLAALRIRLLPLGVEKVVVGAPGHEGALGRLAQLRLQREH